jgi:cardiolipin synthase
MVDRDIAPVLPSVVILCMEILVYGMREYLAELKIKINIPVSYLGKVKTATQMLAITILLIGEDISGIQYFDTIGEFVLWVSAGLTVITGYSYLSGGMKHFK